MAGTRAIFASIGASVTLVAAAALSLLAVSAVLAFGGWADTTPSSVDSPLLVFAGSTLATPSDTQIAVRTESPLVVRAPERRAERSAASAPSSRTQDQRSAERAASAVQPRSGRPRVNLPTAPPPPPAPAAPQRDTAGDHVSKVGESLSSTVQGTGSALADATQPLAPPVSAAVQQVLNIVAELVRRTTDGLGGALDTLVPPR